MNTSYSWLKRYIPDLDVTPKEYTDSMTLSGTKVEGFTRLDADIDRIIVGQVEKIEPHPDADKLVVCQVNVGEKTVQIVTGADNAFVGAKVPVVLDGGKVAGGHDGSLTPGGIEIKAGKLRGVESDGMMCSIEELGSTRDFYPEAPEEGLYIFEEDVKPGDDAIELLGLHDTVFEYEITSNRVDCYSVLGIAREAAATFGKKFVPPAEKETGNQESASDYISVRVEDEDLCPRFCARVVKNIKIGPSPKWMQRCLSSAGIRPINNVVDITNFVMEEFGQPMHAYDLDTIAGQQIVVRRAKDGEKFVTLDGQERQLDNEMLMICDGEKPIGLAGIMGGENSMITDHVRTMLFEAANFNGTNIRLSSKRVGLRTEASGKFEKGLDPENARAAIDRACQLIEELGAGEVVGGIVDVYPAKPEPVRVKFEPDRINALLGTDISPEQMLEYFVPLELEYDKTTNEIIVPSFRQDVRSTADLAEEVARFFGYDNIATTLPHGEATVGRLPFDLRVEEVAREVAEFRGFSQGMSYSFESPKVFDKLMLPANDKLRQAIEIMNPLGEDFSIMRTTSLNGMLTSLGTNFKRRNKDVRLYEIGNIYLAEELPLTKLPDERMQFTLGFYGVGDFFELKGVVEEFLLKLGMKSRPEYDPENKKNYFHPGRQADILYEGTKIGCLGEIHPLVADAYGMSGRVYVAVVDLPSVLPFASFDRKFEEIARFPAVTRDISMVVEKSIPAAAIEKMIRQRGGKTLESVTLFDVYEGDQIAAGFKSMAYSLVFRSKEKTLQDDDVNRCMKKILNGLESMGIQLRA